MKRRIDVLKTDITRGKRDDPYSCAINLALQRSFGKDSIIRVGSVEARVDHDLIYLPKRVQRFISRFDRGERAKLKPFSFTLEA